MAVLGGVAGDVPVRLDRLGALGSWVRRVTGISTAPPTVITGRVVSFDVFADGVSDRPIGLLWLETEAERFSVTLFPHVLKRAPLCTSGELVTVEGHQQGYHVVAARISSSEPTA